MKKILPVIFIGIFIFLGCSSKSEYMLQQSKQRRMAFNLEGVQQEQRYSTDLRLDPKSVFLTKNNVSIHIEHLDSKELDNFFKSEERFGKFAGENPYFNDLLVFYIKITNNSNEVIRIKPGDFIILDKGNNSQYMYLDSDYIISLYKLRSSVYSVTNTTGRLTPGGIYGAPLDVATNLAGRSIENKLIQLKTVELTGGYIYSGVIYDGLIVFFKPSKKTKDIILFLPNIKTKFNINDEPIEEIEFEIPFKICLP